MDITFDIPKEALALLRTLEASGAQAWFVGGFVRDAVLNAKRSPIVQNKGDIDIACSMPASDTMRVCAQAGYAVHETGIAHPSFAAKLV